MSPGGKLKPAQEVPLVESLPLEPGSLAVPALTTEQQVRRDVTIALLGIYSGPVSLSLAAELNTVADRITDHILKGE